MPLGPPTVGIGRLGEAKRLAAAGYRLMWDKTGELWVWTKQGWKQAALGTLGMGTVLALDAARREYELGGTSGTSVALYAGTTTLTGLAAWMALSWVPQAAGPAPAPAAARGRPKRRNAEQEAVEEAHPIMVGRRSRSPARAQRE